MALRNPDWNNKWLTRFGTVSQRNFTGEPRYVKRSATLHEDGFAITISANALTDVQAFEAAYLAALGTAVTYTDFEGSVWTGYWKPESYQVTRGMAGCNYKIEIEFSGNHA